MNKNNKITHSNVFSKSETPGYTDAQLHVIMQDYKETKAENERLRQKIKRDTRNLITDSNAPVTVSNKPEYYIMGNSKLSNELPKEKAVNGLLCCNVNPSGIRSGTSEASVYASLRFDTEGISLPLSYTPYDREIFNTVCSLFEAGNVFIWPEQIYRTMTGKTGTERVSPQSVNMITQSMKQMTTIITIDATKQFEEWGIEGVSKDKHDKILFYGNMLYLEGIEATINGQTISGWKKVSSKDPILFEYNKLLGQVVTVSLKLLDTNIAVKNTPEIIILKNYLIREIERMKNPKGQRKNIITYKSAFDACQIDATEKVKRKRLRDSLRKILEYWKSTGYIENYSEIINGQRYEGVHIVIPLMKS